MQVGRIGDCGTNGKGNLRSIAKGFMLLGTIAAFAHPTFLECDGETLDAGVKPVYKPAAEPAIRFQATAYCEHGVTKSGIPASPGIVAADPRVLPLGSLIQVDVPSYCGVYQVMDTGRLVKGRIIDIYIPDHDLATEFGRRVAKVTVLRYGFPPSGEDPEREELNSVF